jgi:serine phosphatase RsbU (regulator of sigma subunit)
MPRRGIRAELAAARSRRRVAALALLLAIVYALRAVVHEPSVGVTYLALVPVLMASYWFGRAGGVLVALTAVLLYVVTTPWDPQPHLLTAVGLRLLLFCSVALVFARLIEDRGRLMAAVESRDRELGELRALRAALIPPDVPERPNLDLASVFVPAEGAVGGDFYLVTEGPADATIVVVGDVVGKGIEAARRASFVRAALATFSEFTDNPCRLLEMANAVLIERAGTSPTFVTAACASFRPGDAVVRWAIAGHPPPLRLDGGPPLDGVRPGMPLGIEIELQCQLGEHPLSPGEGVVLFTDGLIEARGRNGGNPSGAEAPSPPMLGVEGVEEVLAAHRGEPAGRVVEALRAAALDASGGVLPDDLCIVAARAKA